MSSTDFCGGHVSSIDFLCLEQFFVSVTVPDTENLWRTHVLRRNVSSTEINNVL